MQTKTTGIAPSEILNLRQWAQTNYPIDDGWWVSQQFNNAVIWAGLFIESKLNELDPDTHKPRYKLEDLLADRPQGGLLDYLKQMFGIKKGISKQNGSAE